MSRQRILSPEFFTDERICSLPPLDRLLFQGLWGLADREGRLAEKPFELKIKVMPVDDIDVSASLDRIGKSGLITRYEIEGQKYVAIRNFLKFQKPHPRESPSTIPGPEKVLPSHVKALPSPAVSVSVSVPVSVSETVSAQAPKEILPVVYVKPAADPLTWTGEDFFQWAQWRRQEAGFVGEVRRPRGLGAWWSTAMMTLGSDIERMQEAFYRFGDDPHWLKATPPLPFSAFVSQWDRFVPKAAS